MRQSAFEIVYDFLKNRKNSSCASPYEGLNADWYEKSQEKFQDDVDLVALIMQNLSPELTIELGSGAGRVACEVAHLSKSFRALDSSQSMISRLNDKVARASIRNLTGELFDFNSRNVSALPRSADLILLMNNSIFYSIDSQGCQYVLKIAAEMLKPGGHFFIDWSPVSAGGNTASLLSMSLLQDRALGTRIEMVNPVFDPISRKRKLYFVNVDVDNNDEVRLSFYEHFQYIPTIAEILAASELYGFELVSRYSDYKKLAADEDYYGTQCSLLFRKRLSRGSTV